MPDLSVIIITWNAERYVKNCMDSVLESTQFISTEIIVIDNGSTDSTRKILQSYQLENIIFIPQETNLGVAKARNIGLKKAKGKYLWLLDIDTVVNEQAISCMLQFLQNEFSCGIAACKLKNSLGEIQNSCRKFPSLKFKINNVLEAIFSKFDFTHSLKLKIESFNSSQFYKELMDSDTPFPVEYVIGACQLIKRDALEEVGLLDENIFYGPEDADFCMRMWEKNRKVYYLPQVSIIHEYQQITNKKIFSRMSFVHIKALFYYFWKHTQF
jgi:GT2 family glycosyltransferase